MTVGATWKLIGRFRLSSFRRILHEFREEVLPHRRRLVFAFLCMLGANMMELLRPWPIKIVLDYVISGQTPRGALQFLSVESSGPSREALLGLACASIVLLAVLGGILAFGQALLAASVGQKIGSRVRRRLYGHIQRLSLSFHDRARTGDLLMRLTGDISAVKDMLTTALLGLGSKATVLIGMAVVMALMDPVLTLLSLAVLPLLALSIGGFSGRIREAASEQRRKEGRLASRISETLQLVAIVQAFGRTTDEEERFTASDRKSLKAGLRGAKAEAGMSRSVEIIVALGTGAVFAVGAGKAIAGSLTPGDLIVFVSYLRGMYRPLRSLASEAARIAKGISCGERILEVLHTETEIQDLAEARPAPRLRGEIQFDRVSFAYRAGEPILRDISFHLRAGEVVALVGESGAGKTTVANLIPRLYDATSGIVRIDGEDIRRFTLESLRAQIAVVPQQPLLFSGTIRDNIAYGSRGPDPTREEIETAARIANAHEFIVALPKGYDTLVGERGVTLSGGERQRIAIARAAIREAPILILDEPATGLDARSERAVTEALFRILKGRTALVIAHHFSTIEHADRILVIEDGSVAGDGTRESLLRGCDSYRRLHDLQIAP